MEFLHGGDLIGQLLAEHGVRHLYTLCGGHISPILAGAKAHGVQVVDVRDEASAAFAADAASRLTGVVGVCAITAGPGVTNTVTAVKNAQMAEQPLIVFGGATATVLKGRGSLQDIDQMAIMKPITKWCKRIKKVGEIRPFVTQAFEEAVSGVPGPVFLEVPVDVLYEEATVAEWYLKESGFEKLKGLKGVVARAAMKAYLKRQFHMPHIPIPSPPKRHRQGGIERALPAVVAALGQCKQPVLVIGSQALAAMTPGEADSLASAVNKLGLPTFLGGSARGLLGHHSPLQLRHKRTAALREADLVIVAGFPFDFRMGYGQKINKHATVVSINLNQTALTLNRRPTIAVNEHPGSFLVALADHLATTWVDPAWFATLREREAARDTEIALKASAQGERVDPIYFFTRLEEKIADDSVLIVDGGDFVATGAYILRPRRPMSWLDPGVFGTLGVGGGFALGAAGARPEAEIWLLYGDGSSAYSLAEFDTYKRHGYAPIAVIGTDASWHQIARDQVALLHDDVGTVLLRTDYHLVAEAYGGRGLLLTDASKVDEVIDEAKRLAASGVAVCINVHLASSDFREGSISI